MGVVSLINRFLWEWEDCTIKVKQCITNMQKIHHACQDILPQLRFVQFIEKAIRLAPQHGSQSCALKISHMGD